MDIVEGEDLSVTVSKDELLYCHGVHPGNLTVLLF